MRYQSSGSRWTAVIIGTVVLFVASVVPSPLRRHPEWKWIGPDKFLHLLGHAVYAVTLADALGRDRYTDAEAAVLAVSISTTHSLVTGQIQKYVPGRAFELADVLASLLGAVLAVFGWYVVNDAQDTPPS
ncbi:VanZ like family protein [Halogeometricum borinquense DSM 11551]|uniref:VanZ like family protein n=2 Tax=Halogeometricum borinquense TaxID=60847 RepID=E4NW31_HALBP|nr:VanZ family protein [Halogeometricum borinquense]ADQ69251.1 VanZ like family protein [Halogeometricum borinquense DSM 11551]ELY31549.1 VanZ like family protein [Halogeometricum borinquense DSM 11551]RYJ08332.1 teicoplanin resistance protein VanZ [Halogeometricum borinquense]